MRMVDLFCGRGGWSKGFLAHGWECIGIDLFPQPLYPGRFIQSDIAQLVELPEADFYCCSSPCEQFSVHGMKHFHKNPKWPWLGLALFEHSWALLEATNKPFIMENVRSAQNFIGPSVNHCGPFYLWGPGVPAIMPKNLYQLRKGQFQGDAELCKKLKREGRIEELREYRSQFYFSKSSSGSPERKLLTAKFAQIPEVISGYLAQCWTVSA